ncbi:selenium-binding family protein [Saccharothrix obliqua]|uniref:selenium-binding family protein n=1 Tax=Saccharothrix obliqua TaxID=2861747 RepID=UPI002151CFAE|nr:selenium-binding family protein [Saccharothrix obliqua]
MRGYASTRPWSTRGLVVAGVLLAVVGLLTAAVPAGHARVEVTSSSVVGTDGRTYRATNHLVPLPDRHRPREWLLAWAGDADNSRGTDPDFLAVIDATKGSPTYGRVVNTAVLSPQVGSEPHHMQYVWHAGDRVYAGAMFTDTTFVLDVSRLPEVRLTGINLGADTPCASVPDAYWVLRDGTAYGSYMGGPDVSGPCTYSNGETRVGNGFAGSPGGIVRIGEDGRTLSETPASTPDAELPELCGNVPPLPRPSCANPHGVQAREDLDRLLVSDFAEVRNYLDPDTVQLDPKLLRTTVRIFDIADRDNPKLVSVTPLPVGPRQDEAVFEENQMVMETTVTNRRHNKGAFAGTMAGGAIYYTPDITDPTPEWRQVFDNTAAYREFDPTGVLSGRLSGGSWLQTSPDDRYLFNAVMGSDPRLKPEQNSGMVYVLDIRRLLAAGDDPRCRVDTPDEVTGGGVEADCPALVDVLPIKGGVGGPKGRVAVGPHWGAMDNFERGRDGRYRETGDIKRLATANYFVAQTGIDGDHRVCVIEFDGRDGLRLDESFRDENDQAPCVDFERASWPHGDHGGARPHGVLFAVAAKHVR